MLPRGPSKAKLSRLHLGGMGTAAMKWRMGRKNIAGLEEQMAMAAELGVRIYVCDMSSIYSVSDWRTWSITRHRSVRRGDVPVFRARRPGPMFL